MFIYIGEGVTGENTLELSKFETTKFSYVGLNCQGFKGVDTIISPTQIDLRNHPSVRVDASKGGGLGGVPSAVPPLIPRWGG